MSSKKTKNPAERRHEPRRIAHERCQVLVSTEAMKAAQEPSIPGIVIDISSQGIGLVLERVVAPGTKISFRLKGRGLDQEFEGRCMWYQAMPSCGKIIKQAPELSWRTGVKLAPRSEEDTKLFKQISESL